MNGQLALDKANAPMIADVLHLCAGFRQLPFCGLAIWGHHALQAVPSRQVLQNRFSVLWEEMKNVILKNKNWCYVKKKYKLNMPFS
ncbi:MAG: hypothetical protein KH452_10495 [Clostridiales bacterium]|nr:hypothetical protein [Clostridiales bacterium]